MPDSAWLVGSVYLEASNIEVNAVNVALAAGNYYLRSANAALSLVDYVLGRIQTQVPTADMYVTEGRTVRIEPDGANPVAIDWLSNLTLRDLLGHTANIASTTSPIDAPNISPLLWSPGFLATPDTILGTAGSVHRDQSRQVSADGREAQTTTYYTRTEQTLSWSHVLAERMRVAAGTDGGGTFFEFHEQSLALGYRCRYYESQSETESSTTEVTWDDSADNSFGPYYLPRQLPRHFRRVLRNADLYSSLELRLVQLNRDYS